MGFGRPALRIGVAIGLSLGVVLGLSALPLTRQDAIFSGLPTLTTTNNGHTADPINVVLVGSQAEITAVFTQARWLKPDPIDSSSTLKIIQASITNSSYPAAPVSNLYLFHRVQDLAFEYPTSSVRQRHHIRLWLTSKTIDGQPVWLGAATFDSGIELSGTSHLPTHHISPDVDAERSFVAASLAHVSQVAHEASARITFPILWGVNGSDDWYFDDGNAVVITLRD